MAHIELINALLDIDEAAWPEQFTQARTRINDELAWAAKAAYDEAIDTEPERATKLVALVVALADRLNEPVIYALATWLQGMGAMDAGRFEAAHTLLSQARDGFLACQEPGHAAATQLSNFRVLAMLGRDEEALAQATWALAQFEAADDELSTGKLLLNWGILDFFRDRYPEAEARFRQAHAKFAAVNDQNQLLSVENNLATVLTAQYKFTEVDVLYRQALARAEAGGYTEAMALLERNLGCLALFQGHFTQALEQLESSRRRYANLDLPHELVVAEQEIADAYLELNLAPEAAMIYQDVLPRLAALGLAAEEARAHTHFGRALLLQGKIADAKTEFTTAQIAYEALDNPVGAAVVLTHLAEVAFLTEDFATATELAAVAEANLLAVNAWGRLLQVRWLWGISLLRQGKPGMARQLLEATLQEAEQRLTPQIVHRCLTALGEVAVSQGDIARAEASFKAAAALIEEMRAPLPAEQFRIAFLSDKLTPYTELIRLCLLDGSPARLAEALGYVERARTRTLLDLLNEPYAALQESADPTVAALRSRIEQLREELNWFYSQIQRADQSTTMRGTATIEVLQAEAQTREKQLLDLMRSVQQQVGLSPGSSPRFALDQLRSLLGADTAFVAYFVLDKTVLAFVVTEERLTVVTMPCPEETITNTLQQLYFQFGALRYGQQRLTKHQQTLLSRTQHHLHTLYKQLIEPLAPYLGQRRLLVSPHRALHHVPFHALYDGTHYLMEEREVCYTPSAAILEHCIKRPIHPPVHTLLLGVADEQAPRIDDEITALQTLFPTASVLRNKAAMRQALMAQAPTADILHLACHGRFRSDNPLFSALQLGDGWLTVHDAAQLNLRCNLVTLSACETGRNATGPGDELFGLARGFLVAGAPAVVMSLWTVDDSATTTFMHHFYQERTRGVGTGAALRHAQRKLLETHPHPFFWAPFILCGRWH